MTPFQIIAALVTLSAIGAYLNNRYFRFPQTIGLMAFALAVSLVTIILSRIGLANLESLGRVVGSIDFSDVLLHGMLSFLLFAGAMHINLEDLRDVRWSVGVMATVGVIGATFITGALVWQASRVVGLELPYIHALLFGALISPTDPIAVLAILKDSGISRRTYTRIGAESLFNDGVGVVLFLTILQLATSSEEVKVTEAAELFLRQALGGAVFGIACGWTVYRLLLPIDDYKVEVLLTLALATGGYAAAEELVHVSAPIFMVTAGLIVGNHGRNIGMSERTRGRLDVFWELVDEVLNAVLFILIGLEIVVISVTIPVILGILAILAVLLGRLLSVGIPAALMGLLKGSEKGTIALLTWGGLRGGLSIAMALSLPAGAQKDIILPITYIVVLFSILVQGLTFKSALPLLLRLP